MIDATCSMADEKRALGEPLLLSIVAVITWIGSTAEPLPFPLSARRRGGGEAGGEVSQRLEA
jgi:hypothetical protein